MSFEQDKIFTLKGKAQHYAWGGFNYIPHWLGIENKEHKPYAEYWMGAHPSASSVLIDREGAELSLYQAIQQNPQAYIGSKVFEQFGELPYLFKILDVKDMLSIQVHPSKTEAVKGFDAEEAAGVPVSAGHRNYKDKNHKPEVMVALSDEFWLLHGFLGDEALLEVLQNTPEFGGFDDVFNLHGHKGLYQYVMELPQEEVNSLLAPLVARELQAKEEGRLQKHQPGWWVSKLYHGQDFTDIDRGVFSIYFFNIVKALPGEAIFQGAGMPHAYLEGQNVELMANSDNVLRGGLTPKHVDVPELVKHTIFEETVVNIMVGEKSPQGEVVYNCPVPDFGLSKIELTAGQEIKGAASSLEIIVVMQGGLQVAGANTVHARKGSAIAILPGEEYIITTTDSVLAYKAFVPQSN